MNIDEFKQFIINSMEAQKQDIINDINKIIIDSFYINIFKITKKSITIQAMFVSLSRSKVLSSLALVAHFRVELCQIRDPIIKKHPNGVFFVEKTRVL